MCFGELKSPIIFLERTQAITLHFSRISTKVGLKTQNFFWPRGADGHRSSKISPAAHIHSFHHSSCFCCTYWERDCAGDHLVTPFSGALEFSCFFFSESLLDAGHAHTHATARHHTRGRTGHHARAYFYEAFLEAVEAVEAFRSLRSNGPPPVTRVGQTISAEL